MNSGPDATAGSADVSPAPSLSDSLAEMFGDMPDRAGAAEPESTSDAGTTPGEPATGTVSEAPSDPATAGDGAAKLAGEGTTPAAAATPATDEASDPFADTTPATFMVNGKPFTAEDIRVFKEGGAVIRPDALPNVLNRLSERESLFERNRAQSHEYQTLAKVSEWTDTASGKTYTGPEAAIELRIGNAGLFAENKLLVETLTDPDKLFSILATEQVADGKGGVIERVVVNPAALAQLQRENAIQQREIAAAIREHYKGVMAEAAKPQAAPIDFAAETPPLIAAVAEGLKLDASVLTPQDRAMLTKQLPFHIKDGKASVEWQELVKDRIQDRAQQKTATQSVVSATEKATKEAQARMAAAARGVKPTAKVVQPATPTPTQESTRAKNEGDAWDIQERAAARALQRRA